MVINTFQNSILAFQFRYLSIFVNPLNFSKFKHFRLHFYDIIKESIKKNDSIKNLFDFTKKLHLKENRFLNEFLILGF